MHVRALMTLDSFKLNVIAIPVLEVNVNICFFVID